MRDSYCDAVTVFQIRAIANMQLLELMRKSIEDSRKLNSISELLPHLSEDLHWLINFFPIDASVNFEVLSTSEAATLMRVVPSDKKEGLVTVWRVSRVIEGRYRDMSDGLKQVFTVIGLSETNVIRRGSYSIDLEALKRSGEDLRRIDSAASDILKEIGRQIDNYSDLLFIVQDGLTRELGISSRFVKIEKIKSSE